MKGCRVVTESALKDVIEPATHRCTWTLSKPPDETTWETPGDVILLGARQPAGGVYGRSPVDAAATPGCGVVIALNQHFSYPRIFGKLETGGLDVVLLDPILTVFAQYPSEGPFHTMGANAHIDTWAALVGRGRPISGELLVDSGVIQLTHLDAFALVPPIQSTTFPANLNGANPTWRATYQKASQLVWEDDEAEVTMSYHGSSDAVGGYHFRLLFSPAITIELKTAIPLADFYRTWVRPLHGLLSASTGRNEDITYLSCSPILEGADRPPHERQFRVFLRTVTQSPYGSDNDLSDKYVSAIRLSEGESLLDLLRGWQQLQREQNPILNTYDAYSLGPEQMPRARFLLLIQALEGLCGFEKRLASQLPNFLKKRESVLGKCKEQLTDNEFAWLDRMLRKDPFTLDSALSKMLKALPLNLQPELTNCNLVKSVRSEKKGIDAIGALRQVRNDLSHGTRAYDEHELHDAVGILQRVVRGHLLRLLGASDAAQERAVQPPDE